MKTCNKNLIRVLLCSIIFIFFSVNPGQSRQQKEIDGLKVQNIHSNKAYNEEITTVDGEYIRVVKFYLSENRPTKLVIKHMPNEYFRFSIEADQDRFKNEVGESLRKFEPLAVLVKIIDPDQEEHNSQWAGMGFNPNYGGFQNGTSIKSDDDKPGIYHLRAYTRSAKLYDISLMGSTPFRKLLLNDIDWHEVEVTQFAGCIAELEGDVEVRTAGKDEWQDAEPGMMITGNDEISTGVDSKVILNLGRDHYVTLGELSHGKVSEIKVEPGQKESHIGMSLLKGDANVVIDKKIVQEVSFHVSNREEIGAYYQNGAYYQKEFQMPPYSVVKDEMDIPYYLKPVLYTTVWFFVETFNTGVNAIHLTELAVNYIVPDGRVESLETCYQISVDESRGTIVRVLKGRVAVIPKTTNRRIILNRGIVVNMANANVQTMSTAQFSAFQDSFLQDFKDFEIESQIERILQEKELPGEREITRPVPSRTSSPSLYISHKFNNGAIYYGQMNNDRPHGNGMMQWKSGRYYKGKFNDGNALGGWVIGNTGSIQWGWLDINRNWLFAPVGFDKSISFNNGRWNDLSAVFQSESPLYFFSDNKYSGTAKITIFALYDQPQHFWQGHYAEKTNNDKNQGHLAQLDARLLSHPHSPTEEKREAVNAMSSLGVPQTWISSFGSGYFYRIIFTAPDQGNFSSILMSTNTAAVLAIGRAEIDYVGDELGRARIACFSEGKK